MASLPTRTTASFAAIAPVPSLDPLDAEFNQYVGATGIFNGGTTGTKLLVKSSDGSDPPIEIDQIGAGPLAEWKQNGALKTSIANSGQIVSAVTTGTAPLSVASTTVVTNLNADTVDGIQGSNIAQLDTHRTRWTANFFIQDPSTFPLDSFNLCQQVRVPGANFTARWFSAVWATGSASGSFTLEFRKRSFDSGSESGALGTITFNSGTALDDVEVDMGDVALSDNDSIYIKLTARSSPLQRDVSISIKGWQTFST